jgi:hypothetical protein
MGLFPTLVFFLLTVPVLAIACVAMVKARREVGPDRPMMFGAMGSGGGEDCYCDGGGGGGGS